MKYLSFLPLLLLLLLSPLFVPQIAAQNTDTPTIFYCVGSNTGPPCVTPIPSEPVITDSPITPGITNVAVTPTIYQINPITPTEADTTPEPTSSESATTPTPTTDPCTTTDVEESSVQIQSNDKKHHPPHNKGFLQKFLDFFIKLIQTLIHFIGVQLPGTAVPCPQTTITPTVEPTVAPTEEPTPEPTIAPTDTPVPTPTVEPTPEPTETVETPTPIQSEPTAAPTPTTPTTDPFAAFLQFLINLLIQLIALLKSFFRIS